MIPATSRRPSHWLALAAGLVLIIGCNDSGGTGTTPDYAITLAPPSLSIVPGEAAATTVTIDRTDFAGEVALSLSGTPAGVTASFDPVTTTGDASTLTLSVGGATSPGTYNMSVRGTASVGNRSRQLALTVTDPPSSFTLSLAPSALTIAQGGSNGSGVIITRTDFTGAVTLALSGAPAGVTWTFDPVAPTGLGSTLTITVGPAVTPGVYDLTVSGTGSVGNDSAILTLTVTN